MTRVWRGMADPASVQMQSDGAVGAGCLPPPLLTSEPGSFAQRTIRVRQPQIIDRLAEENGYPPSALRRLGQLRAEVLGHAMQPLREHAPDRDSWNRLLQSVPDRRWLETSWYLAESFFYRRVLEAVGYYQPGRWQHVDPFAAQKREQETEAASGYDGLPGGIGVSDPSGDFEALLHASLWGNRADLSHITLRVSPRPGLAARSERHNILVDDSDQVFSVMSRGLRRVDVIADNAGRELLADLALADYLLHQGWVGTIVLHLKDRPFFVSDAMPADLRSLLDRMAQSSRPGARSLSGSITRLQSQGRLRVTTDPFWTSGLMFRQFPAAIAADLGQADLVILKGDLNYRRLLDDRHWPYTTPLADCGAYFPAPYLVLRTLKGELVAGLGRGVAEACAAVDGEWLTNGKRGLIQMGQPRH